MLFLICRYHPLNVIIQYIYTTYVGNVYTKSIYTKTRPCDTYADLDTKLFAGRLLA